MSNTGGLTFRLCKSLKHGDVISKLCLQKKFNQNKKEFVIERIMLIVVFLVVKVNVVGINVFGKYFSICKFATRVKSVLKVLQKTVFNR